MLKIRAQVSNSQQRHNVTLKTNNAEHAITIAPKASGFGSSANGGELLFLALATCYCNDIFREATRKNIAVQRVEVEVSGEFGDAPGSVAQNITYSAVVEAKASEADILELMRYTDTVAEIQNTLRLALPVTLTEVKALSVS
ncbi:MAG: OsmC family protein [Anaerolineae bacterium]|nr:OsmC family protein [Anaerolineae bacterium]